MTKPTIYEEAFERLYDFIDKNKNNILSEYIEKENNKDIQKVITEFTLCFKQEKGYMTINDYREFLKEKTMNRGLYDVNN